MNETIDTDKDGNPLTYLDIIKTDDTIADDLDLRIKISKTAEYIKSELCGDLSLGNRRFRPETVPKYNDLSFPFGKLGLDIFGSF